MQLRKYKFKHLSSFESVKIDAFHNERHSNKEIVKTIEFVDSTCEKIQRLHQGWLPDAVVGFSKKITC